MEQTIDSIDQAGAFAAARATIDRWEIILATAETTKEEVSRLEQELEAADREEQALLNDHSLNETACAKKLLEIRGRTELKRAKLQAAKRALGCAALLTPKERSELQKQVAELRNELAAIETELDAISGGSVPDIPASKRVPELTSRKEIKKRKLATILARLDSESGLLAQANAAGQEVQRQVRLLVERLIRKRETEMVRLLEHLCGGPLPIGRSPLLSDFASVGEACQLRLSPYSNANQARALFETISRLSEERPLAELLRICEQKQSPIAEIEEVTQAQ
jgi:DNA repair exonuclease SbcCD ATPase subunit